VSLLNNDGQLAIEVAGVWMGRLNNTFREAIREASKACFSKWGTEVLHHDDCMLHLPRTGGSQGDQPWESPDRIETMMGNFGRLGVDSLVKIITDFPLAMDEQILRCHSFDYLDFLYSMEISVREDTSPVPFTPAVQRTLAKLPPERTKSSSLSDTSYSAGTLIAARRACGAVLRATADVIEGKCRNAFCVIRPPGHHVGFNGPLLDSHGGSCGFSILNSVMVAAMDAVERLGKRVAILDLDVHHGNGTEHIIRELNRPKDILFISIHLYDGRFYPASGAESDLSRNIYNIPISPLWGNGDGRTEWLNAVRNRMFPLVAAFRPDVVFLSMGFDGANGDVGNSRHQVGQASQVGLDLLPSDFSSITEELCRLANGICEGRIVSVLEGGYGKFHWTEVHGSISDASTHAGSDDSSPSLSLRNGRKRLRPNPISTRVINRQPLANAALHHLKALMGLIQ
jgi:acetoin utilization deacetylase AcuC-like enzyme